MEPTILNPNNQIIIRPYNVDELTSLLQKIPKHIIVQITQQLGHKDMFALATTCRLFTTMKIEFIKVSPDQPTILERRLKREQFSKEIDEWFKKYS